MLACPALPGAQADEVYLLTKAVSNRETIVYERVIRFDERSRRFHVRDFAGGRIQMDAFYSAFDRRVKEERQCNHRSNTKEGRYVEWHPNGQKAFEGHFVRGRANGLGRAWYPSGRRESEEHWLDGRLHGRVRYWSEAGALELDTTFVHGMNQRRRSVTYRYLAHVPTEYEADPGKRWPLVIYLHGGSGRGTDLEKLYAAGIPDQIYRGRQFPFILLAPQCPLHLRWSTDDWFEAFLEEAKVRYRIDADRIYLTGPSLGGSGTWYLAARYPGVFAAIAPISGFTSHLDFIDAHLDGLVDLPIWAFHGRQDTVVPFEETARIVARLGGRSRNLRFSDEPEAGHELMWKVYPGEELYEWLLRWSRGARAPAP